MHPSSVSRALTGKYGVSEDTRVKVLSVAQELGYVPDLHARALRLGKRTGLAIIVEQQPTDITSRRNQQMFQLGNEVFGSVHVMVQPPDVPLESVVRQAIEVSVAAIIISGLRMSLPSGLIRQIAGRGIALATVDGRLRGVDAVSIRREVGTRQVARYFILAGFLRPLFLTTADRSFPDERLTGIMAGYTSLKRSMPEGAIFRINGREYEHGYRLAKLVKDGRHDAVFCYNDRIATGLMRGLEEIGIKVPADCSIVGFDDVPFARYLTVPLSTVAQPTVESAEAAVMIVRKRIHEKGLPRNSIEFPTHLELRGTTREIGAAEIEEVYKENTTEEERHHGKKAIRTGRDGQP